MSGVRAIRPTDLVALAALDSRSGRNDALTWERLRPTRGAPGLLRTLEQALPLPLPRHLWVRTHGPLITGLVSARRRPPTTWEIDWLVTTSADPEGTALALLDGVAEQAGRAGALQLALRLATDSWLLPLARRAGFVTYALDLVFVLQEPAAPALLPLPAGVQLRSRQPADDLALFRLYNRATPAEVRMQEAASLAEWRSGEQARSLGKRAADIVAERADQIVGRIATGRTDDGARLHLLADPNDGRDLIDALVSWGLADIGSRRPVVATAPAYAVSIVESLTAAGFGQTAEHALLSKRLTRTVSLPRAVAVAIPPAIPV